MSSSIIHQTPLTIDNIFIIIIILDLILLLAKLLSILFWQTNHNRNKFFFSFCILMNAFCLLVDKKAKKPFQYRKYVTSLSFTIFSKCEGNAIYCGIRMNCCQRVLNYAFCCTAQQSLCNQNMNFKWIILLWFLV